MRPHDGGLVLLLLLLLLIVVIVLIALGLLILVVLLLLLILIIVVLLVIRVVLGEVRVLVRSSYGHGSAKGRLSEKRGSADECDKADHD